MNQAEAAGKFPAAPLHFYGRNKNVSPPGVPLSAIEEKEEKRKRCVLWNFSTI
jgi:hypothetical protein